MTFQFQSVPSRKPNMPKHVAIYARVSGRSQDTASQEPDLKRWIESQASPVIWYQDKFTGKTMDRPGFQKLMANIEAGKVSQVVCWRLDRLGRTAKGLTTLFEDLNTRKVGLVSLKDGLDLSTPAGRLMAHVLASVAAYETEIRAERVRAGQEVAKSLGQAPGASQGHSVRQSRSHPSRWRRSVRLKSEGEQITRIARATGLSRPTVYSILGSQV